MKTRLFSLLFVCSIWLAACSLPLSQTSNGPQAWIDKPLNGSLLPLAPVEVLSHASDLGGVANIELSVNGSVVAVSPSPNPSETLVNVTQTWTPPQPGNYLLQVRAQNSGGVWGAYASATITITGGDAEEPARTEIAPTLTPTLTPEASPTSTLSPTATSLPTSTPTSTATQILAGTIQVSRVSTYELSIEGGACGTQEVTILVNATHPAGIQVVVLFFKLTGKNNGETTEWFSKAMSPQGGDQYAAVITVGELMSALTDLGVVGGAQDAWLAYQAVIQTPSGDTSTHTSVFSDITITICPG